ncbi:hypothetical protein BpHYR1_002672 [Brachionus plicatilis]|uniref:Uncharacterized protein n=1 Tax=Brachionus plicatilis TaxID=10195 RepID=A0A3M7SLF2_BRAPC|nr:hypothetical protein BpHYR1_002672 [Brachionus plicatilis]
MMMHNTMGDDTLCSSYLPNNLIEPMTKSKCGEKTFEYFTDLFKNHSFNYDLHKNFYQYLLHLDKTKVAKSYSVKRKYNKTKKSKEKRGRMELNDSLKAQSSADSIITAKSTNDFKSKLEKTAT